MVLKILHVNNTAGVASTLAKYQTRLGHNALVIVRSRHMWEYQNETPSSTIGAIRHYIASDVVHYHSTPWIHRIFKGKIRGPDYLMARAAGKKTVWHFHGQEAREDTRREMLPRIDGPMIVSTPDLLRQIPEATWIPNPVDVELFSPRKRSHTTTVIGCYCSPNPYVRAFSPIDEVLAAAKALRRNGKEIEVRLLSTYKHSQVSEYFGQIDIWVDKFGMNFYGLCALEASLCHVPVMVQIGEPERSFIPSCPFVITERDRIREGIEYLLDEDVRQDIGRRGDAFTRQYHDPIRVAEKFLKLYADWA